PFAVATQRLQTISRRHAQRVEAGRGVELNQLPIRDPLNLARQSPRKPPPEHPLGFPIPEALDHAPYGNATRDDQASTAAAGSIAPGRSHPEPGASGGSAAQVSAARIRGMVANAAMVVM